MTSFIAGCIHATDLILVLISTYSRSKISNKSKINTPIVGATLMVDLENHIHMYVRPQFQYSSISHQCLNFRDRGFDVSPFSSGWLAVVGLSDPCLHIIGQVWGLFRLAK